MNDIPNYPRPILLVTFTGIIFLVMSFALALVVAIAIDGPSVWGFIPAAGIAIAMVLFLVAGHRVKQWRSRNSEGD